MTELRKPESCPNCSGADIRRICYGRPLPEPLEKAQRGEVVLGGRFIQPWSPDWECQNCRHRWFDPDDPGKQEIEALPERILERARRQR